MRQRLLGALVVAVIAAGCGGGDDDTSTTTTSALTAFESFAREFSVICQEPSSVITGLASPSGPVALAANAREVIGAAEATLAELRTLRAPSRQGEVDELVAALGAFTDAFRELADAASSADDDAVDAAVTSIAEAQREVLALSTGLGIDCGLVDPDASADNGAQTLDAGPPRDPAAAIDGFGANSQLDDLAADCFDDDLDACDSLFRGSPTGSAYERYASTCGERYVALIDGNCAAVGGEAGEPSAVIDGYGTDVVLDDLADACFSGDLISCNELFFASAEGSGHERYGATCGARTEREIVGFCPQIQLGER